jgi:hypothetical protein
VGGRQRQTTEGRVRTKQFLREGKRDAQKQRKREGRVRKKSNAEEKGCSQRRGKSSGLGWRAKQAAACTVQTL